jgi:NAD(P)-dependent dehydrogenase (short-subunit alcohol dehydrogenase family)
LVTGASTGIGFELAKVFADRVSAKMHSTQAEPGSAEDS